MPTKNEFAKTFVYELCIFIYNIQCVYSSEDSMDFRDVFIGTYFVLNIRPCPNTVAIKVVSAAHNTKKRMYFFLSPTICLF